MQSGAKPNRPPYTQAVRRALRSVHEPVTAADLLFLEAWEIEAPRDLATLLRAGQIRRANRALAAEIEAELKAG